MNDSLIQTLESILKTRISPDASIDNTPQWDSLKHIEIIFSVEDLFGVQFDEAEMSELTSLALLRDAIERHLGNN